MAVQTKTLLNDVGSAVLVEAVSQINRAAAYTTSLIGTTFTVPGPGAVTFDFVLCKFTEDVLVTAVEFGFGSGANTLDAVGDIVFIASGTNPDGSGGTVIADATNFGAAPANNFVMTDTWATMADLQAVSVSSTGSGAPFQLDAGDALALRFTIVAASTAVGAVLESATVSYRPFKDALNLQPAFTPAMTNFRSVAR